MPVSIREISVQNLGPHSQLSFQLGKLNLIFGHNENGKTFLVEFIIRSLFKHTTPWNLRKQEARGKVILEGLADEPVEFWPSSEQKIEDFWEITRPGLPPDFSRLLVVKGAEVDIAAEADGGIDATVLKRLLSNREILDHIQKRISKTVRESKIQSGLLTGPKRGEMSARQDLEKENKRIFGLFERINKAYSGGERKTLEERKCKLEEWRDQMLRAKRFLAYKSAQEIKHLEAEKNRTSTEQILAVRSQLSHYRRMVAEYRQKQQEQKKAAEQSGHYEWLKSAREVYQNNLGAEVAQPPLFFLVAAIILLLNAAVLSFLSMPVYAAGAIALGGLVGFLYFTKSRKLLRHATEKQEIENLKATFEKYFGSPLTSLPDILGQLEKLEQDYNIARVLAQQLKDDLAQLHTDKRKIDEAFQNLTSERPEPGSWDGVLQQQEKKARALEARLRDRELFLAQLDVAVSDYLNDDPEVKYNREELEKIQKELEDVRELVEAENRNLASLKQLVCQETEDDISASWEIILANLQKRSQQILQDYKAITAEIAGKILVNEVVEELRKDEESKILAGLRSPEVQTPIYQVTNRYHSVDLQGEKLVASDQYNTFDLADLSTGAQEQVLLALRIGFAARLMQGDSLFLILDDAFQYSDWRRRKLLVDKVAELAENGWQIIYFSMDDNIRTLFDRRGKKFGEDYKFINLDHQPDVQRQQDVLSEN